MSSTLGVKASFSVQGGTVLHTFQSRAKENIASLQAAPPPSDNPVRPSDNKDVAYQGDGCKFDHQYTGRHDHGTLLDLKSGGPHGDVVQALLVSSHLSPHCCTINNSTSIMPPLVMIPVDHAVLPGAIRILLPYTAVDYVGF